MKKILNKVFFISFVILWGVLTVCNLFKSPTEFSENENRYLAKFPAFKIDAFLEGVFMTDVDIYLDDQFLLRDQWITMQSTAEYSAGKREINGVMIGKDSLFSRPGAVDEDAVSDNLRGIEAFTERYGLPSYLMIVPSAYSVENDKRPALAYDVNDEEAIGDIYSRASGMLTGIDVVSALEDHKEEYIYYRTDHHWTTYGAYLAYERFCSALGFSPAAYSADKISDRFNGTLYSSSGIRFITPDSMTAFNTPYDGGCEVLKEGNWKKYDSVYFPEYLNRKDKYAYFLGTNEAAVTLHGTAGTGKNLLVFKDSYSHCLAPMLLAHYDTVTLIDPRYINREVGEIVDAASYDDVLYLFSFSSFTQENNLVKLMMSAKK